MSLAAEDMLKEHRAVMTAMKVLEKMTRDQNEGGFAAMTPDFAAFITFLHEYTDKCHHGKEEVWLFPAVQTPCDSDANHLVDVLLDEHSRGRALIQEMADTYQSPAGYERLKQAAHDYIILLRRHVQKENFVLLPMTEKLLTSEALEAMFAGFTEHEEKVVGHARHAELLAMLDQLEQKYLKAAN